MSRPDPETVPQSLSREIKKAERERLEQTLLLQMRAAGMPKPEREVQFYPHRKWRFDFCFWEQRIGVECEGGSWSGGRHTRGKGFEQDCEKYNTAALLGFRVFRFTLAMIESGNALWILEQALKEQPRHQADGGV